MSSTSNVQDLLVNVFRPTYTYDSNLGFVPSLVLSNVTEVITSRVRTDALIVSDSNLNTYIGCNAGVNATDTASNVGIGYSALGGAVNSSNNVALGAFALNGLINSDCNVAIGTGTDVSSGSVGMRNVLIGTNVRMGGGSNNILIGVDISRGTISNQLQIGQLLYGDLCSGYIGINTSAPAAALDISGVVVFRDKVGFQNPDPDFSLDVNGDVYANGTFIGGDGTVASPLYTFFSSRNTGMYVPIPSTVVGTVDLSTVGTGAFGIATNAQPAAIFTTSKSYFMKDLDVSGTFTARSVNLSAFAVSNGTANQPTVTFTSDNSTGLFLVASNVLGVSTGGVRRMAVLSNGDVSMGQILVSDISASGAIFSSSGSNSIGGVTLSNGFVITSGTTSSSNLLVPGFLRNADPATTLDISGGNISNSGVHITSGLVGTYLRNALTPSTYDISGGTISNSALTRSSNFRGSNGSVSVPTYSFVSDASTGLHLVGGSALGFDTSGVLRMCLSGGFLGIGTAAPRVALDVSGDISANVYNGPGGTAAAPHYTFSDDRTTGVFFPGANIVAFTAGGTERMRISNAAVGIGTTAPTNALDVSGVLRVIGANGNITFSNGTIDVSGTQVFSSSGALSNAATTSNSIGGVTLSNTNVQIGSGTVAAPSLAFVGDVSSGVYRPSANAVALSVAGVQTANFSNTLIELKPAGTAALWLSNGQAQLMNGVVGTPSLAFAADASSGLYRPNTNQIGFVTAGVQRMLLSNSVLAVGRTPVADTSLILQTASNAYVSTGRLYLGDAANSTPAYGAAIIEGLSNGGFGACDLLFYSRAGGAGAGTDPRERMRIVGQTGNVGIGTTAPAHLLDISSSGAVRAQISGQDAALLLQDQRVSGSVSVYQNNANYGIYSSNALPFYLYQSNGVRLAISNGNVGIGTTAPLSALDLSDGTLTVRGRGTTYTPSRASLELGGGNDNTGTGGFPQIAFQFYNGGFRHFITSRHNTGSNSFANAIDFWLNQGAGDVSSTSPGTFNRNILSVTAGGVGVAISNPSYSLDVSASAAGTASVNMSTWARSAGSVCYYATYSNRSGDALIWSNVTSIDSNLVTVADLCGTYFRINKSGIYAVSAYFTASGSVVSAPTFVLDVSTNATSAVWEPTKNPTVTLTTAQSGTARMSLSFTGYLPSNASNYYKIKTNSNAFPISNAHMNLSFLGEVASGPAAPFITG